MPINYAGPGNWKIGNFRLPELQLTEKIPLISKKSSVASAQQRSADAYASQVQQEKDQAAKKTPTPDVTSPYVPQNTKLNDYVDKTNTKIDEKEGRDKGTAQDDYDLMKQQLDDEFSSVMGDIDYEIGKLNTTREGYEAGLPVLEQNLQNQYTSALPELEQSEGSQIGDYQGQQGEAEAGAQSILSQARRNYGELVSGASRFQGSASEAYGELLGRATAQTMGEARNELRTVTNKISTAINQTKTFYKQKREALKAEVDNKISQARLDYNNRILEIGNEIARMGSSKIDAKKALSTGRLQALRDFNLNVNNIRDAADESRDILERYTLEKQEAVQAARDKAVDKYTANWSNVKDYTAGLKNSGYGLNPEGYSKLVGQLGTRPDYSELEGYIQPLKAATSVTSADILGDEEK